MFGVLDSDALLVELVRNLCLVRLALLVRTEHVDWGSYVSLSLVLSEMDLISLLSLLDRDGT